MLEIKNVSKSFPGVKALNNVSVQFQNGEIHALLGENGAGKSTLMNVLTGVFPRDKGEIEFDGNELKNITIKQSENMGIAFVHQELNLFNDLKVYENIFLQKEYTTKFGCLDKKKMIQEAERLFQELGVDIDPTQQVSKLKTSQKQLLEISKALFFKAKLLILDEPTNHLDIAMTEWLEKYLQEFKGGLLVVSHDRAFLDNIATRILEMEGGHLTSFKGNYSKYLVQKELQTATLEAAYASQQDYIARTEAYIRRFKAGIKSKMARGRQSQLDRLERMDAPVQHEEFALRLPPAPESAERVLILDNLSVGYGDNVLLHDIDLVLRKGEKVGLLGPNGTGKTTLLKTVLGELPPLKGTAQIGNRVKGGYFSQSYERLAPKQTLLDNFLVEYGFTEERTRSLLGGMLFHGDDVFKEIGTLSGGQKARLVLLKLVLDGANCLVLDEPTNDLDIVTLGILEEYLQAFKGCVIVVSHDRYFVDKVADHLLVFCGGGEIRDFAGTYSEYVAWKREYEAARRAEAAQARPKPQAAKTQAAEAVPRKLSFNEKRELEALETEIPALEAEKAALEASLSSGTLLVEELTAQSQRIAELIASIDEKTMRWLELSER